MSREVNPKIAWPLIALVVGMFGLIYINRVAIKDWAFFNSYDAPFAIEQLSDAAGLSEEGERLFYRADPQLVSESSIANQCGDDGHKLGCIISGPQIFILQFDPADTRESNQAVVTAAHEMLHLAYFRMSDDERAEVDALINEQLALITDRAVLERIASYPDEEQLDEAHSIIATEVEDLTPELEEYYSQYFDDRQKVVEAFKNSRGLID